MARVSNIALRDLSINLSRSQSKYAILQTVSGIHAIFLGVWWAQFTSQVLMSLKTNEAEGIITNIKVSDFWSANVFVGLTVTLCMIIFSYLLSKVDYERHVREDYIYLIVSIVIFLLAYIVLNSHLKEIKVTLNLVSSFVDMGRFLLVGWGTISLITVSLPDFFGFGK